MADDQKQELLREKFMQFQSLQQYIEQINEHINLLHKQHLEIEESKEALQEFSQVANGLVLAPIANGIFIKAETKDNQNLLVNVGVNTVVEKPLAEVIKLLNKRQKETSEKVSEAQQLLHEFSSQAEQIYRDVEALQ